MRADHGYDSKERGFSVPELLIVLAIISALATVGLMSFNSLRDKYDAERVVKELYIDLTNARVRSMERNRIHFVVFGVGNQYAVYEDNIPAPDGDGVLNTATDTTILSKSISPKYPLTWPGAPGAWTGGPLQFNSKGMVPTDRLTGGNVVRVTSNYGSEYDCLTISEIKTSMGKWNGTQCISR